MLGGGWFDTSTGKGGRGRQEDENERCDITAHGLYPRLGTAMATARGALGPRCWARPGPDLKAIDVNCSNDANLAFLDRMRARIALKGLRRCTPSHASREVSRRWVRRSEQPRAIPP